MVSHSALQGLKPEPFPVKVPLLVKGKTYNGSCASTPMLYAFTTLAYPNLKLIEVVERVKGFGFDGV